LAITDIGTLQTAVESWLERTFDDSLFLEWANDVADKLTNGVMSPDGKTWFMQPVRVRSMETQGTIATTSAVGALPASWLEFKRIWIDASDGSGKDLTYLPLRQFRTDHDAVSSGTPTKYTIDGDSIYVAPTTDATLQVTYYTKLGAFTGDSSTDDVLTNHPGLYRQGVMAEACDWISDYERGDRERMKFYTAANGLNAMERRAQTSGAILIARPGSVV
jgi:hypothetical protein